LNRSGPQTGRKAALRSIDLHTPEETLVTASSLPTSTPCAEPGPAEPRWSARRTLAFVVASSIALWAGIITVIWMLF